MRDGARRASLIIPPWYYRRNDLEVVPAGHWELLRETGKLFDLQQDLDETRDVSQSHLSVVGRLSGYFEDVARDRGHSAESCPRRWAVGGVEDPRTVRPYADED